MAKTNREEKLKSDLIKQLKIINGQVTGLINQIEKDKYCIDIINQVNAVRASLHSVSKKLITDHIDGCVKSDKNNEKYIEEIKNLIDKISR